MSKSQHHEPWIIQNNFSTSDPQLPAQGVKKHHCVQRAEYKLKQLVNTSWSVKKEQNRHRNLGSHA